MNTAKSAFGWVVILGLALAIGACSALDNSICSIDSNLSFCAPTPTTAPTPG